MTCSECDRPAAKRGFCNRCYDRKLRKGEITRKPSVTIMERFWSYVPISKGDGCWEWKGSRESAGYGQSWDGNKQRKAHRVMYRLINGILPDDMDVLHKCDNPPCVNPSHLFIGTDLDNARDKVTKGRAYTPPGELHYFHKLTEQNVLDIRRKYSAGGSTYKSLALEYGVYHTTIEKIIKRHNWKHI